MDHLDLSAGAFSKVGCWSVPAFLHLATLPTGMHSWLSTLHGMAWRDIAPTSHCTCLQSCIACWHNPPAVLCVQLAPQGKGIIGLQYRPVPCSMAVSNESATPQAWDQLRQDVGELNSSRGQLGWQWGTS